MRPCYDDEPALKVVVVIKTSRSTANSLSRFVLVAFGAYNLPITMNSISPDVNLLHIPALLNPRKRWIPSNASALSSGEVPKNTQEIARHCIPHLTRRFTSLFKGQIRFRATQGALYYRSTARCRIYNWGGGGLSRGGNNHTQEEFRCALRTEEY